MRRGGPMRRRGCVVLGLSVLGSSLFWAVGDVEPAAAETALLVPDATVSASSGCVVTGSATVHGALSDSLDSSYVAQGGGGFACDAVVDLTTVSASGVSSVTVTARVGPTMTAYAYFRLGTLEGSGVALTNSAASTATVTGTPGRPGGGSWSASDLGALRIRVEIPPLCDEFGCYDTGDRVAEVGADVSYTAATTTTTTTTTATTTTTTGATTTTAAPTTTTGATTTTTAATTTTSTLPPLPPASRTYDSVPRGRAVSLAGCGAGGVNTRCSAVMAEVAGGNGGGGDVPNGMGGFAAYRRLSDFGFLRVDSGGDPRTGTICMALGTGSNRTYTMFQVDWPAQAGPAGGYSSFFGYWGGDFSESYMWRLPSGIVTGYEGDPDGLWSATGTGNGPCAVSDPGRPGVPTPGGACERKYSGSSVVLTGRVLNSRPGATDEIFTKFPWEGQERAGATATVEIPTVGMPAGGWVVYCRIRRSLAVGVAGSTGYKVGALWRKDHPDLSMWSQFRPGPDLAEAVPGLPGSPGSWVPTIVTAGASGVAGAGGWVGPIGLNVPTVAGLPVAAITGWLVGGAAASLLDWLGVDGDQETACRWNPTYRVLNSGACAKLLGDGELRSVTKLGVCATGGCVPIGAESTEQWNVGEVIIERRVFPPSSVGRSPGKSVGTGAAEVPELRPAPGSGVDDFPSPEVNPGAEAAPEVALEKFAGADQTPPLFSGVGDIGECWADSGIGINPLSWVPALVRMVVCALKALFWPSGSAFAAFRSAWDQSVGNLVGVPLQLGAALWNVVRGGAQLGCSGPTVTLPGAVGGYTVNILSTCSGITQTIAAYVRPLMLGIIWLTAILLVVHAFSSALGIGGKSAGPSMYTQGRFFDADKVGG